MIAVAEPKSDRQFLYGIDIDPLRMPEAVDRVLSWVHGPEAGRCRYVVTPNVDHLVMLRSREDFRHVYDDADLVLADGLPLVLVSRLLGRPLPERVTGSDLVPNLFDATTADRPVSVFLLGAMPGVGLRAKERIERDWPHVSVVGVHSPPYGFERIRPSAS